MSSEALLASSQAPRSDEHVCVPVDHKVVPHASDVQVGLDDELNEVVGPLSHPSQARHGVQAVGDEMLLDVACDTDLRILVAPLHHSGWGGGSESRKYWVDPHIHPHGALQA